MDNKNILIIIGVVIIALVAILAGVFLISTSNGEIVIDNVAGVNNVTLPAENFSAAGNIPITGYSIVHYKPLGKDIHFYDLNMSDTGYTNLINTPGINNSDVRNISGISGTLNYYPEAKTLIFIFEANNKLYSIDVMFIEQNQVAEAEVAITILLSAWLKASGYQQTQTLTNTADDTIAPSNVNKNSIDSTPKHGQPGHECDPGDQSCRDAYNRENGYPDGYDGDSDYYYDDYYGDNNYDELYY